MQLKLLFCSPVYYRVYLSLPLFMTTPWARWFRNNINEATVRSLTLVTITAITILFVLLVGCLVVPFNFKSLRLHTSAVTNMCVKQQYIIIKNEFTTFGLFNRVSTIMSTIMLCVGLRKSSTCVTSTIK